MDISIRTLDCTDIPAIAALTNNLDIAKMTASLPYPYTQAHAETWLDHVDSTEAEHVFGVCLNSRGKSTLIGVVGLVHEAEHKRAELGYWLGVRYWRRGYMSAAVQMAVAYGFTVLDIHRIYARCFADNPASIRILEKNGFVQEGCLKHHFVRMDEPRDMLFFGLLNEKL